MNLEKYHNLSQVWGVALGGVRACGEDSVLLVVGRGKGATILAI